MNVSKERMMEMSSNLLECAEQLGFKYHLAYIYYYDDNDEYRKFHILYRNSIMLIVEYDGGDILHRCNIYYSYKYLTNSNVADELLSLSCDRKCITTMDDGFTYIYASSTIYNSFDLVKIIDYLEDTNEILLSKPPINKYDVEILTTQEDMYSLKKLRGRDKYKYRDACTAKHILGGTFHNELCKLFKI